jgi:hypothetical protein
MFEEEGLKEAPERRETTAKSVVTCTCRCL